MLALPNKGFNRSVAKHNVDASLCCDWIEACALFGEGEATGSDVVDLLRENEIYATQDFAWELVNDAFLLIRERKRILGAGYPFSIQAGTRVVCNERWEDVTPYAFCLILSLSKAYPKWWQGFGPDFGPQGLLFEELTAQAVPKMFVGWETHQTGWSAAAPNVIAGIVQRVADLVGEATGDIGRWSARRAKEAGLDLLCYRPFSDGRNGIPIMFFQCASGQDWQSKVHTPELRIWTKIISFAADPQKAFAMPFSLNPNDFRYHANRVNGLLLDRVRLLSPGYGDRDWISADLRDRLIVWLGPRIQRLPSTD